MGFHPQEIEMLSQLGGERVLEVGSGKGYTASQMAELFGSPVGVEPALDSLFAPEALENYRGVDFAVCAACGDGLPFPDGSFDGAVSHWAVHHYRYPVQVFTEVYRVLRPGGWFYIADGIRMPLDKVSQKQRGHLLFHIAAVAVDMRNRIHHFPLYDADALSEMVARVGFKVEKVEVITDENPVDRSLESDYIRTYIRRLEKLREQAGGDDRLIGKVDAAIEHIRRHGIRMGPFAVVVARRT